MLFFNKKKEDECQIPSTIFPTKPPQKKTDEEIKLGENWIAEGEFGLIIVQIEKPNPNPWRLFKGKPIQLPYLVSKEMKFSKGEILYFLVKGNLRNLTYLLAVHKDGGGEQIIAGDFKKWEERFNFFKNIYWTSRHIENLQNVCVCGE